MVEMVEMLEHDEMQLEVDEVEGDELAEYYILFIKL
jgi:hypothetical protein